MGNRKNIRPNKVKNFMYNTSSVQGSTNLGKSKGNPEQVARNLSNYITPVQLQRLRTDISMWRDSIGEAERAYFPFRVKMQRIFIDSILDGHVFSLMERRKDLTLLRKFAIQDKNKNKSDELTEYFEQSPWFQDFLGYCLDAIFYGYSLVSLGDVVQSEMQDVSLVPRWFISPDRLEVGSYVYSPNGAPFLEEPYKPWHIWVPTTSDSGISPCGYGLLYQIARYEIFLRNTLGFNGDFVELYAMPYRVGKTTKTSEAERAELEAAVKNMGSAGYAIVDPMDEIQFLEASTAGTGYKAYDNLESRCEAKVSKIILGHADAVDSVPGKLGAGQGGESPVQQALEDKKLKDARFIEPIINNQLIPRLKALGVLNVPDGYKFVFLNDGEAEEARASEDSANLVTANIAKTMKDAGLQMDAAYFEERTGIKSEKVEEPAQVKPGGQDGEDLRNNGQVKNMLHELYS
jgi:phage gp29-like protein